MKLFKTVPVFIIFSWFLFSCTTEKEKDQELPQHIQLIEAARDLDFSNGQTVYVPAYSQINSIYSDAEESRINLAVTLSIRNTDIDKPIIIKSVSYYSDNGTLLKEYVETPFELAKMASTSFNIGGADTKGGIGANFIVVWDANQPVVEPYIQAIMLGAKGTHGFSWRNPGYVIKEGGSD